MKKQHAELVSPLAVFLTLAAIALPGAKQATQKSQFLGTAQDNAKELVRQGPR